MKWIVQFPSTHLPSLPLAASQVVYTKVGSNVYAYVSAAKYTTEDATDYDGEMERLWQTGTSTSVATCATCAG